MGVSEEVKAMKKEGKSDGEIMSLLSARGVPNSEINDAISRAQIKEAVSSGGDFQGDGFSGGAMGGEQGGGFGGDGAMGGEFQNAGRGGEQQMSAAPMEEQQFQEYPMQPYAGMQQSMSAQEIPQQQIPMENYQGYEQYQPYQESFGSDVINEIAELVVTEKLSQIKEGIERTLDFRTVAEARMISLDERLKRIEKIIDKLQLSLLEKVGEYVNNVQDLKKEVFETQKSFKAIHHKKK